VKALVGAFNQYNRLWNRWSFTQHYPGHRQQPRAGPRAETGGLGGEAVRRGQAGRGRHPAGRRHGDGRGGRRDREQEEESRGGEEGEDHVLLLEMFKKIQFQK